MSPHRRRSTLLSPTKASAIHTAEAARDNGDSDAEKQKTDAVPVPKPTINEWIPIDTFDSAGAQPGDLYICIEHCFDCGSHGMSLRHNEKKYLTVANGILDLIVQAVVQGKSRYSCVRRLFAFRLKPLSPSRLGAMEITVSFKKHRKMALVNRMFGDDSEWITSRIHSKLSDLRLNY